MSRIPENHFLRTTKIAHRGLWGGDIPENSMKAFQKCCDIGMAIEIDVYITSDKHVVIFHDTNLKRMTGLDKNIHDCTLAELKELRLDGTDQTIPTLKELLAIAEGKAPLLIEIKDLLVDTPLIAPYLLEAIKDYKGEFAIQSFHPLAVKYFKDNAPHIIRGQLSADFTIPAYAKMCEQETMIKPLFAWYDKFKIKELGMNEVTEPDFVSYDEKSLPNNYVDKARKEDKVIIAWTLTSQERQNEIKEYFDNIIFEFYMPK